MSLPELPRASGAALGGSRGDAEKLNAKVTQEIQQDPDHSMSLKCWIFVLMLF